MLLRKSRSVDNCSSPSWGTPPSLNKYHKHGFIVYIHVTPQMPLVACSMLRCFFKLSCKIRMRYQERKGGSIQGHLNDWLIVHCLMSHSMFHSWRDVPNWRRRAAKSRLFSGGLCPKSTEGSILWRYNYLSQQTKL